MVNLEIGNPMKETRPLTPEELRLLHNNMKRHYIFGIILGCIWVSIGVIFLVFTPPIGIGLFFAFLFGGISFCSVFIYKGLNAKKDEKNRVAEIIKGKLTDKGISGKGGSPYLVVLDKSIPIEQAFWQSVNIGNSLYIEIGPYSKEVFKIKNA